MGEFHYEKRGKNNDILVVVVSGMMDAEQCDYLFGCMEHLIGGGFTKMILDCSEVQAVSSMGLGMLVRVHGRMKRVGGDVKLAGVQGTVAHVIKLVQLDRVFQLYPTVEGAIKAHGG